MSHIAIVGGHGKIALELHPFLVAAGHTPVALVRSEDYRAELESLGAEVRILDIESSIAADYAAAFEGCDAVVFTAGGGADGNVERKKTVDLGGSVHSAEGAQTAGIRRFVQVSAIGVDEPVGEDVEPAWRAYVEAKREADDRLRATGLAWTVLRPGRLTDDPATGTVALGPDVGRDEVTRADVAAVVAAVLDEPRSAGATWNLVRGDTPVADAVAALV